MTAAERAYERRPGHVAASLGEELAVLDMASGSYLGFNATAAHVWRLLDQPRTLGALCQAMTQEFDVDADRCRAELHELLDQMLAAGLIQTRHDGAA